jgi:nicotinamide riboside kinase
MAQQFSSRSAVQATSISGVPNPSRPNADRPPTIAVIGSHGVRKSTAVAGIAAACAGLGMRVAMLGEVIRTSPLGHNESATPEAQLWVIATQIAREIETGARVDVLIADRSVVDNYAYYRRAAGDDDPFAVEPLVRRWAAGYARHLRLLPDVPLVDDGFRSPAPAFRDEIEAILDRIVPDLVPRDRLTAMGASEVTVDRAWDEVVARWLGRPG